MLSRRTLFGMVPVAAMAACASPDPALFTLGVVPGAVVGGGPKTMELRRIGLAAYLDRPSIVRSSEDYQVTLAHDDRWAEPLGDLIARILAQDLTQRLPGTTVFTEAGAITAEAERVVEIDVQRFDVDRSGTVVLAAEVAIRSSLSHQAIATRTVRLQVMPRGAGTAELVAALSGALGQLADQVAAMG